MHLLRRAPAIGLALLLATFVALAARADGPRPMPVNPFTAVAVGDWWVLDTGHESGPSTVEWRVARVEGDAVTLTCRCVRGPAREPWTCSTSKSAPTLALYGLNPDADATVVDEDFEWLGRTFHTKILTYRDGRATITVGLSAEAKGGVLSIAVGAGFGSSLTSLVGFGTGLDPSQKDPYAAKGFHVECGKSAPDFVKGG